MIKSASQKADEIAFLICEIDEAVRFRDAATALRKADELLKIKPGHRRALQVQQDFAGHGDGGLRLFKQFARPWEDGGWIPWSVLTFGLAVFGLMLGVVIIWLGNGKGAIVIKTEVAGVNVAVKDQSALITVPGTDQSLEVTPGDHLLEMSYKGLVTQTKSFTVKKGEKKILEVYLTGSDLVAHFADEPAPTPVASNKSQSPTTAAPVVASPEHNTNESTRLADAGRELVPKSPAAGLSRPKPAALVAPFAQDAAADSRTQWANYLRQPGEFTNSIGMKLRLIPPGEFLMGSAGPNEKVHMQQKPQHKVHISRPYYLAAFEVTRGEFARFVAAAGYKTEAERDGGKAAGVGAAGDLMEMSGLSWQKPGFDQTDAHPVVIVSWNDATAFCRWLSDKEGRTYRLPSEAEWEYACRAGTMTPFFSGNTLNDLFSVGNGMDATFRQHFHPKNTDAGPADGFVFTAPVGSFRPNAFGLYDTHGNVWEWCQDWFRAPYSPEEVTDPQGPAEGTRRVTRGGGFDCGGSATSATRDNIMPTYRYANIGFRVVCEPRRSPARPSRSRPPSPPTALPQTPVSFRCSTAAT